MHAQRRTKFYIYTYIYNYTYIHMTSTDSNGSGPASAASMPQLFSPRPSSTLCVYTYIIHPTIFQPTMSSMFLVLPTTSCHTMPHRFLHFCPFLLSSSFFFSPSHIFFIFQYFPFYFYSFFFQFYMRKFYFYIYFFMKGLIYVAIWPCIIKR